MRGAAATNRSHVLIVGDSGDASLLAALERATLLDGNIAAVSADSTGEVVWVRSVSAALALAGRYRISRILIDSHLIADEKLLPNGGAQIDSTASIVEELERRFERVFPAQMSNPERFLPTMSVILPLPWSFSPSVELFRGNACILLWRPSFFALASVIACVRPNIVFFQRIGMSGGMKSRFGCTDSRRIRTHYERFDQRPRGAVYRPESQAYTSAWCTRASSGNFRSPGAGGPHAVSEATISPIRKRFPDGSRTDLCMSWARELGPNSIAPTKF